MKVSNASPVQNDRPSTSPSGLAAIGVHLLVCGLKRAPGTSIATGRLVASEVRRAVGNSLILAAAATFIGFTLGNFFGFVAGYHRDSWLDRAASALSVIGVSVPHYWLGIVMVIIFSAVLHWLPAAGAG